MCILKKQIRCLRCGIVIMTADSFYIDKKTGKPLCSNCGNNKEELKVGFVKVVNKNANDIERD